MSDGYRFEVQRSINDDQGFRAIDSIESALSGMSSDGFLRVHYDRPIRERQFIGHIDFAQEDIVGRSEKDIIEIIDEAILGKHSEKAYE